MKVMVRARISGLVLAGIAGAGCLHDHLVRCSDGRMCPVGTTCDVLNATCVDSRGLSLPRADIDFASVECGTPSEIHIPLHNFGLSPVPFEADATVNGVEVTPRSGVVEPGSKVELQIIAHASLLPGVRSEGSLFVSTPYELLERTLKLTTLGAHVTADPVVDFGEISPNGSAQRALNLRNHGNVTTDLTIGTPGGPFTVLTESPIQLDPNVERTVIIAFTPGGLLYSADPLPSLPLTFVGPQCQPAPAEAMLRAVASGAPVLSSHIAVDFPTSPCTPEPSFTTITLTSQLASDSDLAMALVGPHAASFAIAGPTLLPAGPDGTLELEVTRQPVPVGTALGARTATLVVSSADAALDPAFSKEIIVHHEVSAPVLSVSPTTVAFDTAGVAGTGGTLEDSTKTQTRHVVVSNSGTQPAAVTISVVRSTLPDGGRIDITPSAFVLGPGLAASITILYTPGSGSSTTFMIPVEVQAPGQCSPTPVFTVTSGVIAEPTGPGEQL
jgi:hypothetical protein